MNESDAIKQKRQLHDRGICVIIPTFNNGGTIDRVVNETLKYCDDVIVVNDGSTDATTNLLQETDGITLIEYGINRGKGHALKCGFKRALEMGFAYAITLDADGQHYPSDIPSFLKANQQHPGAIIVGRRNLEGIKRTRGSDFANKFSNFWFYVQTGKNLKDTQTGYRLYPLKKLKGLSLLTSRYEAELELMVFASWHGVELVSIPINVFYPPKCERVSHFRPGKDFARISVLNTILCFMAVVYGLPLRLRQWIIKYLRTGYAIFVFSFFSLFVVVPLVWLYVKLGKMTQRKKQSLHQVIQFISRFIVLKHGIPGAKFSSQVADETVFDNPHVVICNHQSHLDLLCQLIFSPDIVFLTNDWVWKSPFFGILIRNADYIPVSGGLAQQLPKIKTLVKQGYSIAVFPEGTRSKTCEIGRFHQGAFYLADQLGIDLLPMYLYGTGKVLPKKSHIFHKSPIHIEVGEAISREQLKAMGDYKTQAKAMRQHYVEKYQQLANRIEQDV